MGSLFRLLHQLAHLRKEESYDFDNFSLHEEKNRSVAAPERWLLWHIPLIWPTRLVKVGCLGSGSDTLIVSSLMTEVWGLVLWPTSVEADGTKPGLSTLGLLGRALICSDCILVTGLYLSDSTGGLHKPSGGGQSECICRHGQRVWFPADKCQELIG